MKLKPSTDPNLFFIEPKDKANCKALISNIDWSVDGNLICCCFKAENLVVVWNINTCEMVHMINVSQLNFQNINKALFMSLDPSQLLLSGDLSLIYHLPKHKFTEVSGNQIQDSDSMQVDHFGSVKNASNISKKKGMSSKLSFYILKDVVYNSQ